MDAERREAYRFAPWMVPAAVAIVVALGVILTDLLSGTTPGCSFDGGTGRLAVKVSDDAQVAIDRNTADRTVYLVVDGEATACTRTPVADGDVRLLILEGDVDPARLWIDNLGGTPFRAADGSFEGTITGDGLLENSLVG